MSMTTVSNADDSVKRPSTVVTCLEITSVDDVRTKSFGGSAVGSNIVKGLFREQPVVLGKIM
jgi:hypothetical protein